VILRNDCAQEKSDYIYKRKLYISLNMAACRGDFVKEQEVEVVVLQ